MSYDLALWYSKKEVTVDKAQRIYEHVASGDESVVEAHPSVKKFYDELIRQYPKLEDLSDDNVDDSIWSVSPEDSSHYQILSLNYNYMVKDVSNILQLAEKYHLTCYDPQSSSLLSSATSTSTKTSVKVTGSSSFIGRLLPYLVIPFIVAVIRYWFTK